MIFDLGMIKKVYENFAARTEASRKLAGKPLTLTEKILYTHLWEGTPSRTFARGKDYVDFEIGRAHV